MNVEVFVPNFSKMFYKDQDPVDGESENIDYESPRTNDMVHDEDDISTDK